MWRSQVLSQRGVVARRWYSEEFRPVVRLLAQADLVDRTEAEVTE
ncbi:hypothetical protein GCM10009609_63990 [Pseudonocardia aurantiaca]|uniref:Uncharacterized protein n=1 Tax=Pseudonocardia aurantiaca TaxID=75290 RepID=A0ABW4FSE0_9PSEU